HHGTAAGAGRHDGPAHAVPNLHEGDRAGRGRSQRPYRRTFWAQGREIVADTSTLLQGQRRLTKMRENSPEIVWDGSHHKAVEQGNIPLCARTRQDATCREKAEALQRAPERVLPFDRLLLHFCQGARHPIPGRADVRLRWLVKRAAEAILCLPNLSGEGGELRHAMSPRAKTQG